MKILVISIGSFDTYYSDYHIMRDIIIGFLERGHDIELIQKQYLKIPKYPKQFEKYLGKRLKVQNILFKKKLKGDLKSRYLADVSYYSKVCKLMNDIHPDRIFLQSCNTAFIPVFYARRIFKCPLLYSEQDIFPENAYFAEILSKDNLVYKIAHLLQLYTYKKSSAICTISDDMKSTIFTHYGISKEKIHVIYNWGHEELKDNRERENKFLKIYPKMPGEFRVVYAGNLGKMQNVELILKVAALMKEESNVSFYIVGEGTYEEYLKNRAKENELTNVKFIEMQSPDIALDLYSSADANLVPLRRGIINVALPSKIADCLIANKPMITCFDEKSKFVELIRKYGIENAGTNQPEKLKQIILQWKQENKKCDNTALWKDRFSKKKSIAMYCDVIEKIE